MKYRTQGRTGIEVSPYCLGAMMFAAPLRLAHVSPARRSPASNPHQLLGLLNSVRANVFRQ